MVLVQWLVIAVWLNISGGFRLFRLIKLYNVHAKLNIPLHNVSVMTLYPAKDKYDWTKQSKTNSSISLDAEGQIPQNFNGSNPDRSYTLPDQNLFLGPCCPI